MVASTSIVSAPDSSSSSTSRPSHGNDISWSGTERPSLPRLKRSVSFNRDLDPSLFTSNDDSPLASTSLSSSIGTSRRPSAKRQRNRQQLSCVACHLRKQACDKVVPCSRCIKAITEPAYPDSRGAPPETRSIHPSTLSPSSMLPSPSGMHAAAGGLSSFRLGPR
ncbi:hypothetical protein MVLG_04585 [Microbotryum lychnidis-dioicae p1A1 Lamole]|uniref:Zn(2)-C6 fungal-type domain-containing protein n=1 Tax=Microbotryum lychnidis-dioicae (strain p1A1 Lamole / MvSl-1064) TaxID=683840 RepID=U5HBN7_USTV1|nr:hypothetical protein MVLG_04585 [Microbotryum lychnidis-dioicae p1A1 Lamole]|eukprot:KDE05042.1 hypothetical protein MVLG_04585 [Microbotryum lychnidis-dioicae p1A1 Lamole]